MRRTRLVEIDEVHLVDRQHDVRMPSSETMQACRRVWVRTPLRASTRTHGEVAIRSAGRHVARVLLVARRIGDDELAARRREVAVGDVDGDPLLALGLQAVDQQREGRARRWCRRARVALGAWQLILEDQRVSYSSRPISVVLPSSTLPQVRKRSRGVLFGGEPLASAAPRHCPLVSTTLSRGIRNTLPASSSPSTRPDRGR